MKRNLLICLFLLSSCALAKVEIENENDTKTFKSTDGAATLVLNQENIQVALKTNTMSYREGHSVKVKTTPGTSSIQRVLATDNNIVHFADSEKVTNLIQGKKSVEIELNLDDSGLKFFTFNL